MKFRKSADSVFEKMTFGNSDERFILAFIFFRGPLSVRLISPAVFLPNTCHIFRCRISQILSHPRDYGVAGDWCKGARDSASVEPKVVTKPDRVIVADFSVPLEVIVAEIDVKLAA